MRPFDLWKAIALACALGLSVPQAMAGATNQGDNTAATPGEGSATTKTPEEPDSAGRGTQNMKDKKATTRDTRKSGDTSSDATTPSSDTGDMMDDSSAGASESSSSQY